MTNQQDSWPAGATWVYQATVAEDATGGTHVVTLTVTPGAGNEIEVLYGTILVGNTATAQAATVVVTDGTNTVGYIVNPSQGTATTANLWYPFPTTATTTALAGTSNMFAAFPLILSGTMSIILKVTTTAISVTQTFAIVCRIKGAMPTATLADTVGAPTPTVNTNKVF